MSITTLGWGSQGGLVTTLGWGSRVVDTVEIKACLASINEMLATLESTGTWSAALVTTTDNMMLELAATLESVKVIGANLETSNLNDIEAVVEEAVLVATLVSIAEYQAKLESVAALTATIAEQGMSATVETSGMAATLESKPEMSATLVVEHCVC